MNASVDVTECSADDSDDDTAFNLLAEDYCAVEDAILNGCDGGSTGKAKKKKKKKKKKNGVMHDICSTPSLTASSTAAEKKLAEARYQEALKLLASNDEDGMWIKLTNCFLQDAKLRKLCDAMRKNTQVTSIDLSSNRITAEGAEALANVLSEPQTVPELILLDVRGNDLSQEAIDALARLSAERKDLKVESGPLPSADVGDVVESTATTSSAVVSNGALSHYARQFVQVGNDDGRGDNDACVVLDPEKAAAQLWQGLRTTLDQATVSLAGVSACMHEAVAHVSEEMSSCALPLLASTRVPDLRPHTRQALLALPLLQRVLLLVPPPVCHTVDRGVPKAAVGSHRVRAAELLALLLRAGCAVIDVRVGASRLVQQCALLAFNHPINNAVQCSVISMVKSCLSSGVPTLGQWMVEEDWGLQASRAPAGVPSDWLRCLGHAPDKTLGRMHTYVAAQVAQCQDTGIGLRPCHIGFALQLARLMQTHFEAAASQAAAPQSANGKGSAPSPDAAANSTGSAPGAACAVSDDDVDAVVVRGPQPRIGAGDTQSSSWTSTKSPQPGGSASWLYTALQEDDEWLALTGPDGLLKIALKEQEGVLGGSKPERLDLCNDDFLAGGFMNRNWLSMLPANSC